MQKKLSIIDKESGELKEVQFFVAILGANQYTYSESSMSKQKEGFVRSVENAIRFFEGTPAAIVPDNLKSAVIKSSRFEPTINETLADLAKHYEKTIADAILDRLIHQSHRLELHGESMRKKKTVSKS